MPEAHQLDEIDDLQLQNAALRGHISRLEAEGATARQEARLAREEVLHLRDQLVAAERDQQDLKTARARLERYQLRGWMARMLKRQ